MVVPVDTESQTPGVPPAREQSWPRELQDRRTPAATGCWKGEPGGPGKVAQVRGGVAEHRHRPLQFHRSQDSVCSGGKALQGGGAAGTKVPSRRRAGVFGERE